MKRALSMLGVVAVLAIGFLFAAPAANAQAIRTLGPINGVTCKQYNSAGPYFPSTFWDCTDTGNAPTPAENLVGTLSGF